MQNLLKTLCPSPSTAGECLILRSIYETSRVDALDKAAANKIQSFKASCITPSSSQKDYVSRLLTIRGEEGKKALNSTIDYKKPLFQHGLGKEGTGTNTIPALAEFLTNSMLACAESTIRRPCSTDFFCKTCGIPFFIIPSQRTRVRLKHLKRSRTRRRRASRLKAAKLRAEKEIMQNHRGGGRSFSSKANVDNSTNSSFGSAIASLAGFEAEVSNRQSMSRVTDSTVKNFISYHCTYCGGESLFKGFEPKRQKRDGKATLKNQDILPVARKTNKTNSANQKRKATSTLAEEKSLNFNGDFLALEATKKLNPAESRKQNRQNEKTSIRRNHVTSLSLGLGKKKGSRPKIKANKKASGLHDFLRSLND